MKIRIHAILTLYILLLWSPGQAMGQFVNITLDLPAGVSFPSRVIEANPELNGEGVIWIEIVGQENLGILVNLSSQQFTQSYQIPMFFLNDGTTDFAKAKILSYGNHSFQLDRRGLLIRNIHPKTIHLNAWLGLPARNGITATIEYP